MEVANSYHFDKLYTAAEEGNDAALLKLLEENQMLPVLFLPIPPGGFTALHIAAYHGHYTFLRKLLDLYPHPRSGDLESRQNFLREGDAYEKNTALHEAVRGGERSDIVHLLLKADSTLAYERNKDGKSPLFIAAENGYVKAVEALMENDLKELMENDHKRSDGTTLFDHAHKRSDGRTPLHHAMHLKHYEVVKTLSRNREMVNAEDNDGRTVLHVAALIDRCPREIIEQLLKPDVSLSYKKDKINQQTALHIAATHGNLHFVRCILRIARRSAEIVNKDGRHALHLAVQKGDVHTAKQLLESMPRLINVPDNNGCTALDIVMQRINESEQIIFDKCVKLLRSYNGRRAQTLINVPDANEQSSRQAKDQREFAQINTLSVMAVLIAGVSFQAVIQPPGGTNEKNGFPVVAHNTYIKPFMVSNTLAYFLSIQAAILLVFSAIFPQAFRRDRSIFLSHCLVFTALLCVAICFITAASMNGYQDFFMGLGGFFLASYLNLAVFLMGSYVACTAISGIVASISYYTVFIIFYIYYYIYDIYDYGFRYPVRLF